MKSFKDYLIETKKTYSFKVGVAGELPEGFEQRMKTALEKFSLEKISSGKRTPIQERPLDFPHLENMEVTYYEVDLHYPTTSQVLKEYLGNACSVHVSNIIVRNPDEPVEKQQEDKKESVYEPLLTKEDMGGEDVQSSVGENRVMELLKELEKSRKERDHDPANAATENRS